MLAVPSKEFSTPPSHEKESLPILFKDVQTKSEPNAAQIKLSIQIELIANQNINHFEPENLQLSLFLQPFPWTKGSCFYLHTFL
jgi:hypothetical protein